MYEASGGAAEERGTLLAHDVFRYAVELPPPSFSGNDGGDEGAGHGSAGSTARRDAWWEGVRQRVPDIAVFVRSRTVASLRKAKKKRARFRAKIATLSALREGIMCLSNHWHR